MLVVPATATVAEAMRLMNESHVGCAIIAQNGRLAGIFTERDVLRKVAGLIDPQKTSVGKVMTTEPDTLPASASIAYALNKMSVEGYRHIPLVDAEHRPVGVVAVRDIVAWMCTLFPSSVLNLPPEPGYPKTVDGG
jgi:CBS domain-containing protein